MANFENLAYTPAQVYVDVLAFAKDKTLEDLIPEDQMVTEFRPPRRGEWYLRPFGVPGIAEIDIDQPYLILVDRPKLAMEEKQSGVWPLLWSHRSTPIGEVQVEEEPGGLCLKVRLFQPQALLDSLTPAAKEAQCEKK